MMIQPIGKAASVERRRMWKMEWNKTRTRYDGLIRVQEEKQPSTMSGIRGGSEDLAWS